MPTLRVMDLLVQPNRSQVLRGIESIYVENLEAISRELVVAWLGGCHEAKLEIGHG